MNGIIRPALYARVSSQKQADEKTIESQCHAIRDRIARDGFVLQEQNVFCDNGYSGAELLRPALEQLRDRVHSSLINRIYVLSQDRLSRKASHHAILQEEFLKAHCDVVYLNNEGIPNTPESVLLLQMQSAIAEYEREKILERTRRGRRHAASTGRLSVFGKAPYGYRYEGSGLTATWVVDAIESENVKRIFDMVANKGFSLAHVARYFRENNIKTRKGRDEWHCATIRGILANPAYHGKARWGKTKLSPRKQGKRPNRGSPAIPRQSKVAVKTDRSEHYVIDVPAIIDENTYHRAGVKLDENKKRNRERACGTKYLLSGLTVCGHCGSAMCARNGAYTKSIQYRCIATDSARVRSGLICTTKSIAGHELEESVWNEVRNLLSNPSRLKDEIERRSKGQSKSESSIAAQERKVRSHKTKLDRLIDAYTNEMIEKEEFESRIVPLRGLHDRELAILIDLQKQTAANEDDRLAEEYLKQLSQEVVEKLATADWALKRNLLKLLVRAIYVYEDKVVVEFKVGKEPPNPFRQSPDNRGFLQHWLWRPAIAFAIPLRASSLTKTGANAQRQIDRQNTWPCA